MYLLLIHGTKLTLIFAWYVQFLFEGLLLARWGVTALIGVYMFVRPSEWATWWGSSDKKLDQGMWYRFPHVPRENKYNKETGSVEFKPHGA